MNGWRSKTFFIFKSKTRRRNELSSYKRHRRNVKMRSEGSQSERLYCLIQLHDILEKTKTMKTVKRLGEGGTNRWSTEEEEMATHSSVLARRIP